MSVETWEFHFCSNSSGQLAWKGKFIKVKGVHHEFSSSNEHENLEFFIYDAERGSIAQQAFFSVLHKFHFFFFSSVSIFYSWVFSSTQYSRFWTCEEIFFNKFSRCSLVLACGCGEHLVNEEVNNFQKFSFFFLRWKRRRRNEFISENFDRAYTHIKSLKFKQNNKSSRFPSWTMFSFSDDLLGWFEGGENVGTCMRGRSQGTLKLLSLFECNHALGIS